MVGGPQAFAAFTVGLIIVAYGATMTVETAGNTLVKMLVQPALIALLVVAFGIETPLGSEAILICAFLTSVVPVLTEPGRWLAENVLTHRPATQVNRFMTHRAARRGRPGAGGQDANQRCPRRSK